MPRTSKSLDGGRRRGQDDLSPEPCVVSPPPPSQASVDPNERLLASVIPPPPASLWVRLRQVWPSKVANIVRWSGSREGRNCFFAALAGAALVIGFHRSEASSAASPADALERPPPSAPLTRRASIHSEPHALVPPTQKAASSSPAARPEEPAGVERSLTSIAVEDAEDAPGAAIESASSRAAQHRVSSTKSLARKKIEKRKVAKRKSARNKHKAKRATVARASGRATRRAKSQRTTTPSARLRRDRPI
jgi:hypothetical protein